MPAYRESRRTMSSLSVGVDYTRHFEDGFGAVEDWNFSGSWSFDRVPLTSRTDVAPNQGSKLRVCGDYKIFPNGGSSFLLLEQCCAPCAFILDCQWSEWQSGGSYTFTIGGETISSGTLWGRAKVGYVPGSALNRFSQVGLVQINPPVASSCTITRAEPGSFTHNESQKVEFSTGGYTGIVAFGGSPGFRTIQWNDPDGTTWSFYVLPDTTGPLLNRFRIVSLDTDDGALPDWLVAAQFQYGLQLTFVGRYAKTAGLGLFTVVPLAGDETFSGSEYAPRKPKAQVFFQLGIQYRRRGSAGRRFQHRHCAGGGGTGRHLPGVAEPRPDVRVR